MATGRPAGRPPKPVEVKAEEGNKGKGKLPDTTSGLTEVVIPPLPRGYNAEAKRWWKFLWESAPQTNSVDVFVMIQFLDAWTDYLRQSKLLHSGNMTRQHENNNGTLQHSIEWQQMQQNRVTLNTLMSSIGLTPADRARMFISMTAEQEKAELAKLAGGRTVKSVLDN